MLHRAPFQQQTPWSLHSDTSGSPPAAATARHKPRPHVTTRGEMRGEDRTVDRERGNQRLGQLQNVEGLQGKMTVWASAILVTDQIGTYFYKSVVRVSANI